MQGSQVAVPVAFASNKHLPVNQELCVQTRVRKFSSLDFLASSVELLSAFLDVRNDNTNTKHEHEDENTNVCEQRAAWGPYTEGRLNCLRGGEHR